MPMKTTTRIEATDEEIIEHLRAEMDRQRDAADFSRGDVVDIIDRSMIPDEMGAHDIGVVLSSSKGRTTTILCLHATGQEVELDVMNSAIRLRAAPEA